MISLRLLHVTFYCMLTTLVWYFNIKMLSKSKVLNKNFSSLCDWFIDNKLSIHFGEEKTKSILFSSKHKVKKCKPLNIHYKNIKIKQYSKVTY